MLPTRSTLQGWNPDSLSPAGSSVSAGGDAVYASIRNLDDQCDRLPEARTWAGQAHDAAARMFHRATEQTSPFKTAAEQFGAALQRGSRAIGEARSALLRTADLIDQGELTVSDQWVVLIKPATMSIEDVARLQKEAQEQQIEINRLLLAVGDADLDIATQLESAGKLIGYQSPDPKSWETAMTPGLDRPSDMVPNPRLIDGLTQQFAIRKGEEHTTIREVVTSPDGNVKTAIAMDGTQYVTTRHSPFADYSKENFYTVDERDKTGKLVSKTSSWRDATTGTNFTCIEWPDGSSFTASVDSLGNRSASAATANGRTQALPVELIDEISDRTGAALTGLDKHLGQGGGIPMITKDSLEGIHSGVKFAGPALTLGTTVFNMAMAEGGVDRCVEGFKGASGAGGSAGLVWLGGAIGLFGGPYAPITAPALAGLLAYIGGKGGTELGEFIGSGVCNPTP